MNAPYANLTLQDLQQYQGRVIAVDQSGTGIIKVADTIDALRSVMQSDHSNQSYRTLPIPDLSRVVDSED